MALDRGALPSVFGSLLQYRSLAPSVPARVGFGLPQGWRLRIVAQLAHYSKKQLVRRLEQSIAKRTTIDASPEGLPIGRPRTAFRPCPKRARGVLPTRAPLFPTTDRKLPGLPPR